MYKCKIKICGIKSPEIAVEAVKAGADFIGLVFAAGRRQVGIGAAHKIRQAVAGVPLVGVFKDQPLKEILERLKECGLDIIQLHGKEPPEFLTALSVPVFRSVAVSMEGDFSFPLESWRDAEAFLFDSALPDGSSGGAGKTFDWNAADLGEFSGKLIVAGGLTAENVGQAIRRIKPYAVDVSGGVEFEGEKSVDLIKNFIKKVRAAEQDA